MAFVENHTPPLDLEKLAARLRDGAVRCNHKIVLGQLLLRLLLAVVTMVHPDLEIAVGRNVFGDLGAPAVDDAERGNEEGCIVVISRSWEVAANNVFGSRVGENKRKDLDRFTKAHVVGFRTNLLRLMRLSSRNQRAATHRGRLRA